MPTFKLNLSGFDFPATLDNSKANFRFVVDIRYVNTNGTFATEHAVMPGLDTYWECDTGKSSDANYVRLAGAGAHSFDMAKIDSWDKMILTFNANSLHSIQFKVFDVNRPDIWDKVKEIAGSLLQALIGKGKSVALGALPAPVAFLSDSLGSAADDLTSHLLQRISKSGDTVLFKGSIALTSAAGVKTPHSIKGKGSKGDYEIKFDVEQ
jgi:hypothetical protein